MKKPDFLRKRVSLAPFTSFRLGGEAEHYAAPQNQSQLSQCYDWAHAENQKITILGGGSNVLVADAGIQGLVIHTVCLDEKPELLNDGDIRVSAGLRNQEVLQYGLSQKRRGFAFLAGVYGTIGGALAMNAGTSLGEMKDLVRSARVFGLSGKPVEITADKMDFRYRHSRFQSTGELILDIKLKNLGEADERSLVAEFLKKRKATQPLRDPTGGSTFKNPGQLAPEDGGDPSQQKSAGQLIEECGFKNHQMGCVRVSDQHANFLVVDGSLPEDKKKAQDVFDLIQNIQSEVFQKTGIELIPEIRFLGF
jgi:UDP-N-acetylmuramate dehydrogenase